MRRLQGTHTAAVDADSNGSTSPRLEPQNTSATADMGATNEDEGYYFQDVVDLEPYSDSLPQHPEPSDAVILAQTQSMWDEKQESDEVYLPLYPLTIEGVVHVSPALDEDDVLGVKEIAIDTMAADTDQVRRSLSSAGPCVLIIPGR